MSLALASETATFIVESSYRYDDVTHLHRAAVVFNTDKYHVDFFGELGIRLPNEIGRSVPKRQSEFLAGRYAAKMVLSKINHRDSYIAIGENRAPVWPEQLLGAISHSGNRAVCVITNKAINQYLGVDIECWLTREAAYELSKSIATEEESQFLEAQALPIERGVTIAFSAKESLFKALYPKVKAYFGFEVAVLTELNMSTQSFSLELVETLGDGIYEKGQVFKGVFICRSNAVETLIIG